MPDAATVARQVLCNFNSQRSCDVCIICEPHWGTKFSWNVAVVNHGSPWGYDTYVPIIFSGWNIPVKKNTGMWELWILRRRWRCFWERNYLPAR